MRFGLPWVKLLALTCTVLIMVEGFTFVIRGITFRNRWLKNGNIFDKMFRRGADFALFFGIAVIVVALFGSLSILLDGYGMLVFYILLLGVLASVILIFGVILRTDVRSDYGQCSTRLTAILNGFDSEKLLAVIQKNFHCCGVEKYTDYIKLWELWDVKLNQTTTETPKNETRRFLARQNEQKLRVETKTVSSKSSEGAEQKLTMVYVGKINPKKVSRAPKQFISKQSKTENLAPGNSVYHLNKKTYSEVHKEKKRTNTAFDKERKGYGLQKMKKPKISVEKSTHKIENSIVFSTNKQALNMSLAELQRNHQRNKFDKRLSTNMDTAQKISIQKQNMSQIRSPTKLLFSKAFKITVPAEINKIVRNTLSKKEEERPKDATIENLVVKNFMDGPSAKKLIVPKNFQTITSNQKASENPTLPNISFGRSLNKSLKESQKVEWRNKTNITGRNIEDALEKRFDKVIKPQSAKNLANERNEEIATVSYNSQNKSFNEKLSKESKFQNMSFQGSLNKSLERSRKDNKENNLPGTGNLAERSTPIQAEKKVPTKTTKIKNVQSNIHSLSSVKYIRKHSTEFTKEKFTFGRSLNKPLAVAQIVDVTILPKGTTSKINNKLITTRRQNISTNEYVKGSLNLSRKNTSRKTKILSMESPEKPNVETLKTNVKDKSKKTVKILESDLKAKSSKTDEHLTSPKSCSLELKSRLTSLSSLKQNSTKEANEELRNLKKLCEEKFPVLEKVPKIESIENNSRYIRLTAMDYEEKSTNKLTKNISDQNLLENIGGDKKEVSIFIDTPTKYLNYFNSNAYSNTTLFKGNLMALPAQQTGKKSIVRKKKCLTEKDLSKKHLKMNFEHTFTTAVILHNVTNSSKKTLPQENALYGNISLGKDCEHMTQIYVIGIKRNFGKQNSSNQVEIKLLTSAEENGISSKFSKKTLTKESPLGMKQSSRKDFDNGTRFGNFNESFNRVKLKLHLSEAKNPTPLLKHQKKYSSSLVLFGEKVDCYHGDAHLTKLHRNYYVPLSQIGEPDNPAAAIRTSSLIGLSSNGELQVSELIFMPRYMIEVLDLPINLSQLILQLINTRNYLVKKHCSDLDKNNHDLSAEHILSMGSQNENFNSLELHIKNVSKNSFRRNGERQIETSSILPSQPLIIDEKEIFVILIFTFEMTNINRKFRTFMNDLSMNIKDIGRKACHLENSCFDVNCFQTGSKKNYTVWISICKNLSQMEGNSDKVNTRQFSYIFVAPIMFTEAFNSFKNKFSKHFSSRKEKNFVILFGSIFLPSYQRKLLKSFQKGVGDEIRYFILLTDFRSLENALQNLFKQRKTLGKSVNCGIAVGAILEASLMKEKLILTYLEKQEDKNMQKSPLLAIQRYLPFLVLKSISKINDTIDLPERSKHRSHMKACKRLKRQVYRSAWNSKTNVWSSDFERPYSKKRQHMLDIYVPPWSREALEEAVYKELLHKRLDKLFEPNGTRSHVTSMKRKNATKTNKGPFRYPMELLGSVKNVHPPENFIFTEFFKKQFPAKNISDKEQSKKDELALNSTGNTYHGEMDGLNLGSDEKNLDRAENKQTSKIFLSIGKKYFDSLGKIKKTDSRMKTKAKKLDKKEKIPFGLEKSIFARSKQKTDIFLRQKLNKNTSIIRSKGMFTTSASKTTRRQSMKFLGHRMVKISEYSHPKNIHHVLQTEKGQTMKNINRKKLRVRRPILVHRKNLKIQNTHHFGSLNKNQHISKNETVSNLLANTEKPKGKCDTKNIVGVEPSSTHLDENGSRSTQKKLKCDSDEEQNVAPIEKEVTSSKVKAKAPLKCDANKPVDKKPFAVTLEETGITVLGDSCGRDEASFLNTRKEGTHGQALEKGSAKNIVTIEPLSKHFRKKLVKQNGLSLDSSNPRQKGSDLEGIHLGDTKTQIRKDHIFGAAMSSRINFAGSKPTQTQSVNKKFIHKLITKYSPIKSPVTNSTQLEWQDVFTAVNVSQKSIKVGDIPNLLLGTSVVKPKKNKDIKKLPIKLTLAYPKRRYFAESSADAPKKSHRVSQEGSSLRVKAAQKETSFTDSWYEWIGKLWSKLYDPLKDIASKIWSVREQIYTKTMPTMFQVWIKTVLNLFREWYLNPAKRFFRWWLGSGWDKVIYKSVTNDRELPVSCCRNPTAPCKGDFNNTWQYGCKYKVINFWKSSNLEISILCFSFFATIVMTMFVVYALINGLSEKYIY